MDEDEVQQEESRAERLRQNQRASRSQSAENQSAVGKEREEKKQTVFSSGLFAVAMFVLFDAPIAFFVWTWVLYPAAIMLALVGWLTAFLWMWNKGYGVFNPNPKKNLLWIFWMCLGGGAVGLPGISGFVSAVIIKERATATFAKAV